MNDTSYKLAMRFVTEDGVTCAINAPYADTDMTGGDVNSGMTAIIAAGVYEYKGSPLEEIKSADLISTQVIGYNVTD